MTRAELIRQAQSHAQEAAKRPIAAESAKYRPAAVVSFDSADKVVNVEVILDATTGEFIQAAFTGHKSDSSPQP
jgi:hypothetical protein